MASIFDIPLRETGGPDALSAFEYQHRIAVSELLRIAVSSDCDLIEFDSHDDILVRTNGQNGVGADFIQVKAHALRNWNLSDICSDEKKVLANDLKRSTSLVAKQLNRADCDDIVSFKVVTKMDVNGDLAILKKPPHDRDPKLVTALEEKLSAKFSHLTFPKNRTVKDWIDTMVWRVSGQEQAVDDRNLHIIADVVLYHFERTLTPDQGKEIYRDLLSRARTAAATKEPRAQKSCSRVQLLAWLENYCQGLPTKIPPAVITIIDNLLHTALERCIGRWRNAGLRLELAEQLAADETVGANAIKWVQEQSEGFLWITGDFGAGKSLTVDRVYQEALRQYREGVSNRIPVFLTAKELNRPLGEEIAMQADRIGSYLVQGVYVIIDGADELTHQRARDLVHNASMYSRANPSSMVIITSTVLDANGLEPKSLPPLPKAEAKELLKRLTGDQFAWFDRLEGRFQSDFTNPFFIIQRARFGGDLSRAELVRRMVEEALKQVEIAIQPAEEFLTVLACWQLDNGSPLIPKHVIGSSRAAIAPVLQTRLIKKQGDHYTFSVECVAQWFAALAIERGLVATSDLCSNLERLERWRFAIAMALSQADGDQSAEIMLPMAQSQPAIASLVLRDGLLDWGHNTTRGQIESIEVAKQLRAAMKAWKDGLEPLSSLAGLFPVCNNGEIKKVAVSRKEGQYTIRWHERPELRSESEVGIDQAFDDGAFEERCETWGFGILNHPAWVWKLSHGFIKNKLRNALKVRLIVAVSKALAPETAWAEGCKMLGESNLKAESLATGKLFHSVLKAFPDPIKFDILQQYVLDLMNRGIEEFVAPYPQSDQELRGLWMWGFFSDEQMVKRAAAIYQVAMLAYREVVHALVPNMEERLPRYAAWPYDLKGIVSTCDGERGGYIIHHEMVPIPIGSQGTTDYSFGSEEEGRAVFENWGKHTVNSEFNKTEWSLKSCSGSMLSVWGDNPAAEIVENWIKSDLGTVGWD